VSDPRLPRVVMATARFWPELGGVETHVRELGIRLAARGIEITVAATDRSGRLPAHEVVDGLTVRRFPAYPVNLDLYLAPRLGRFVAHSGADLVHVQGFHTLVAPMAMFAALSAGLPYVVSLHTGGHSSPLRNAVRPLQARLLIPFIRRAGAVICGSRWEAGYVGRQLGLEPERIAIIPSGVDVAGLSPEEAGQPDPDLVVSPGRLEHYKGHHRVVEAFPLILARRPNARLRLLGEGPAEATLREQADRAGIGDRVVIGPVHGRGAAARVMAAGAVVVSMSDYESQGIAIHEAAALGRPTVVANATALGELVDVGAARGVPLDAPAGALADAVVAAMDSPAPTPFPATTWDESATMVAELYGRVLAASRT
jgi:glycosyltransferase involved in cell wall biosynthesis